MSDKIGSPQLGDYVATLEKAMMSAVDYAEEHLSKMMDDIAPRTIGSESVSDAQAGVEYANLIIEEDPKLALRTWFDQRAEQFGRGKATADFNDFVNKGRKWLKKNARPEVVKDLEGMRLI